MKLIHLFPGLCSPGHKITSENIELYLAQSAITGELLEIDRIILTELAKNPDTRCLNVQAPRQSGKSTWIQRWCDNLVVDTIRVFASSTMMRSYQGGEYATPTNVDITAEDLVRGYARKLTGKRADLVLFDDVHWYFGKRFDPDQFHRLVDHICAQVDYRPEISPLIVNLYTQAEMEPHKGPQNR